MIRSVALIADAGPGGQQLTNLSQRNLVISGGAGPNTRPGLRNVKFQKQRGSISIIHSGGFVSQLAAAPTFMDIMIIQVEIDRTLPRWCGSALVCGSGSRQNF